MSNPASVVLPNNTLPFAKACKALSACLTRWGWLNLETQGIFLFFGTLFVAGRFILLPDAWSVLAGTWLVSLHMFVVASCMAICGYLFFDMAKTRSLSASFRILWSDVITWRNAATALPAFVVMAAVMNSFAQLKSYIPVFHPYDMDVALAEFDRWLHLGTDPWVITQNVFGYGLPTKLLDSVYYLWFLAVFVPTAAFIGMPADTPLRHRYMIGYVLVWGVLGIVSAALLSSVGPIYFDRVYGGPSQFSGLVQALAAASADWELQTMQVREALWIAYVTDTSSMVSGISAMPSIHNAMCVLLVLVAWKINRGLAALAAAFAFTIFVGSVHLGWHYAIDGYASALAVMALWKLAGHFAAANVAMARLWGRQALTKAAVL